jgi:uncharacterized protein (DUF58 family)
VSALPRSDPSGALDLAPLAREARLLAVRIRRRGADRLAGAYASAFRGGGIEFEESRPYVPGDDVRTLDWNATARTGEPHVKRFREERDRSVLVLVDTSASMAFGSSPRNKARTAARSAALLAAAAGHAGDRVGVLGYADRVHTEVPPGRGPAHTWDALRVAAALSGLVGGAARGAAAVERARRLVRRRALVFWVSDFRDEEALGAPLAAAAHRHELVAVAIEDPRESELPAAGVVRIADPERPGATRVLDTGRARVRALYAAAAEVRRRALEHRLRGAGASLVRISCSDDPLRVLGHFFQMRAAHARSAA